MQTRHECGAPAVEPSRSRVGTRRVGFAAMADRDPDCLFCKIVAGEIPGTIVAEDERTVAFMDINPATRGHALVVPRRHAANLGEIDDEDLAAVATAARRLAMRARDALGADGINLMNSWGSDAWQTVFHLHMHVIPRYAGDPLRLPWKPEPGDEGEIKAAAEALRGS
jgi:histidine triad (HIT) family protein